MVDMPFYEVNYDFVLQQKQTSLGGEVRFIFAPLYKGGASRLWLSAARVNCHDHDNGFEPKRPRKPRARPSLAIGGHPENQAVPL
jgi:hypothetical protein